MIDAIKRQVDAAIRQHHRVAGVIGWPVAHSLSPRLHGWWLDHYRIPGAYIAIPVRPDQLSEFIAWLPMSGLRGVNVTIPHKEDTARLVTDHMDAAPAIIGAQNTLVVQGDHLVGGNTDYIGFRDNLLAGAPGFDPFGKSALVLGAGGSARAILFALQQMRFARVFLHNRTLRRAETLAVQLQAEIRARFDHCPEIVCRALDMPELTDSAHQADLVINTTAAEMSGAGTLDFPFDVLKPSALVTDIVYKPLITPLLESARGRGLAIVDGLGMLLYQGAPGFEAWFGVRPQVTPDLRAHMEQAL